MTLELRGDFNVDTLWLAAKASKQRLQARRFLALVAIYEGATPTSTA